MIDQVNNGISSTLYHVSSALLLPVMLAVLVLFAGMLIVLGGFLREALDRRRTSAALRRALALAGEPDPDLLEIRRALQAAPSGLPRQFARHADGAASPAALAKALADLESSITVALGRVGFLARVGPMLGLLGTLIPFGPALAGLSSGDVQELSANLVTAFATTVVGLLCGAVAYAVAAVRRGWYTRDFDDIEYIVQVISEIRNHDEAKEETMGGNGRRSNDRAHQPV